MCVFGSFIVGLGVDKILYNIVLMIRVPNDILSPVTLHSVNSVMSYYRVAL
jgi:hypothetical protein